jgi:lipopolysaccharide export system protein LptA
LAATALFAALAPAPPAHAEKADRDKPINFAGDTGDANLQARGGTLAGHVIVTQGTLEIRADRIVFRQNADNTLSATAYGNPVALRQKRDGVDEYYEGYAQRLEYDGSKELVELFDNALLKRGLDEIRSNYVSYNTATELFKAEGRAGTVPDPAGPGARVRGMFQPKSETPVGGKGKDATKGTDKAGAKDSGKSGTKDADKSGAKDADKSGAKDADKSGTKDADKSGAKDSGKSGATASPSAAPEPSVVLKPAGELAPPPTQ